MSKKKDLFRKKLELLSELSVDNVVNISEKGNYYVNIDDHNPVRISKHKIDFKTITKNTINKLFTEKELIIRDRPNMLMLTKTGKLLITYKGKPNIYRVNFTFKNVTLSNYWNYNSVFKKDKLNLFKSLIYLNKKCSWLKDKSYCENGFHFLKQYKSLNELKKHLGYTFLSDQKFESLFTVVKVIDNQCSYEHYNKHILEILITGKLSTLECRKFLVINILESLTEEFPINFLENIANRIKNNFEDFKKGLVIQNTYYKTINYGTSIQSTTEDEDLPF